MSSKIIGIGGFLPGSPISNDELSKIVDTNDEWIRSRTGITQRYFTKKPLAEISYLAAKDALIHSGISANEIDLIIVCTTTPDNAFPSTATEIQGMLASDYSISSIPSMDLNAVCSGFIYGLEVANALIKLDSYNNILLIGADKMSTVLDMNDRSTAVLFGDGAGAVVLKKDKTSKFTSKIGSNGKLSNILHTRKNEKNLNIIHMNGREVFKNAVNIMSEISLDILKSAALTINDIDFFVPHQANMRILQSVSEKISISEEKIVATIDIHANTSAATIPLALNEMKIRKKLAANNTLLLAALGAGLTFGGAIIETADDYTN
jgi:3-oxoacyl-[acyl-carrier-protein] synthase III